MTAPLPAGVLWDMDGTIVDTEPYWIESETALVAEHGGSWSHEQAMRLVGSGLWESAEVLRDAGVDLGPDELVETLVGRVLTLIDERGVPFRPGARELIDELAALGVPQAIVTMSTMALASEIAGRVGGTPFAAIVSGDRVDEPKPSPLPYRRGAELLNVPVADCVAIEDSPTGLRSAVASGATAIAVPHAVSIDEGDGYTRLATLEGVDAAELARIHADRGGR